MNENDVLNNEVNDRFITAVKIYHGFVAVWDTTIMVYGFNNQKSTIMVRMITRLTITLGKTWKWIIRILSFTDALIQVVKKMISFNLNSETNYCTEIINPPSLKPLIWISLHTLFTLNYCSLVPENLLFSQFTEKYTCAREKELGHACNWQWELIYKQKISFTVSIRFVDNNLLFVSMRLAK